MRLTRISLVLVATAVAATFPLVSAAQQPSATESESHASATAAEQTVEGQVVARTPMDLDIETDHGLEHFLITDTTQGADQLEVNDYVKLWFVRRNENNELTRVAAKAKTPAAATDVEQRDETAMAAAARSAAEKGQKPARFADTEGTTYVGATELSPKPPEGMKYAIGDVASITPAYLDLATDTQVLRLRFTGEYPRPMTLVDNDRVEVWYDPGGNTVVQTRSIGMHSAEMGTATPAETTTAEASGVGAGAETEAPSAAKAPATEATGVGFGAVQGTEPSASTAPPAKAPSTESQGLIAENLAASPANGNALETRGARGSRLPQTGSSLPLIGLLGLVALAGAAGLGMFLKG